MTASASFSDRHIGPDSFEKSEMLKALGLKSKEDLLNEVIPSHLRTNCDLKKVGPGLSEVEALEKLESLMKKNQIKKSLIGMGFYGTHTPSVIQRNILESPAWYTAYTPYQAEISQGRLESLLNFQTMVCDLTKMEIANASMLDEGSSCGEALMMALNMSKVTSQVCFLDSGLHPHVIEVAKTRMTPLGVTVQVESPKNFDFNLSPFACVLAYPNTFGDVEDYRDLVTQAQKAKSFVIVNADILALTQLVPPGEWGADIVVGNTQRFGVPLGNGGPHAAFLATRESFKRQLPGRLIGVTIDQQGHKAYRLTLQTREQHIRREKATSNICTAQVLLANMAAMYAVYHGPQGLNRMASQVHRLTQTLASSLEGLGLTVVNPFYFDTIKVKTQKSLEIINECEKQGFNLRLIDNQFFSISLDETVDLKCLFSLVTAIAGALHKAPVSLDKLNQIYSSLANKNQYPQNLVRKSSYLNHPIFNKYHSETELLRYIYSLQQKDISLVNSMIPLGSCTMKLNATSELMPLSWSSINQIHPFAPTSQMQGYVEMVKDFESKLCEITGFSAISFQPNSGAQGEYAGLLVIKKYFEKKNESHRNICLIPSSAHGTNPASAAMAGFQVVVVNCDSNGNIDVDDLKNKADQYKQNLAALMVTYPSTHGVFEESIVEICEVVHQHGGQVYMDGANMNALVGWVRPAEIGADVSHMNLHKTFSIPHGGGGPGVGPIGVKSHLAPYLPGHSLKSEMNSESSISAITSAPWGSASILTISWMYISMMGGEGLKEATYMAILNANYMAHEIEKYFPILYKGNNNRVAHECIVDFRSFKTSAQIEVVDIAKRLMDFGFHAPTMSWPVSGTLMIEPTESENKEEMDKFIQAIKQIRTEIQKIETQVWPSQNNPLKNSPHTLEVICKNEWSFPYTREEAAFPLSWIKSNKYWPTVGRVNDAYGDRNIFCTCPPIEDFVTSV